MHRKSLLGITYSEFDNKVGPQLRYQYPYDTLSPEYFETLSNYVIMGKHLCWKPVVVKTEQLQFMNYSCCIDNSKYDRNALLFAVGCVLNHDANTDSFEPLLRKLSESLIFLELEKEYLFKQDLKCQLEFVLKSLYEQLVIHGEALIQLDEANMFSVSLFELPSDPYLVKDIDVPLLIYDSSNLALVPWDISLQHLLQWIDGEHSVKYISKASLMDIGYVRRCLRTLLYYRCIIVADSVKFSNEYQVTSKIYGLLGSESALSELCDFSILREQPNSTTPSPSELLPAATSAEIPLASPPDILRLLLSLRPGYSLLQAISAHPQSVIGIDVQRLISFAQFHKYIRLVRRREESLSSTDSKRISWGKQQTAGASSNKKPYHSDKTQPYDHRQNTAAENTFSEKTTTTTENVHSNHHKEVGSGHKSLDSEYGRRQMHALRMSSGLRTLDRISEHSSSPNSYFDDGKLPGTNSGSNQMGRNQQFLVSRTPTSSTKRNSSVIASSPPSHTGGYGRDVGGHKSLATSLKLSAFIKNSAVSRKNT